MSSVMNNDNVMSLYVEAYHDDNMCHTLVNNNTRSSRYVHTAGVRVVHACCEV